MGTKYENQMESPAQNSAQNNNGGGYITVGYRGTFAFGRDGLADVQFRKLMRIIVCGKVSLCREAFKETLNESRDPDRGQGDRYTSRFFLKHNFLEQAFDMLLDVSHVTAIACVVNSFFHLPQKLQPHRNISEHANTSTVTEMVKV